jgi:hypothetical protein
MVAIKTKSDPESRIFRSYWQDWALDLSAGIALVITGIFWLTGPAVGQSLAPVIAFVLYPILRKRVTEPRLGYVRFSEHSRSRLRLGHWLMIGVGLATFALGLGFYLASRGMTGDSSLATTLVSGLPAVLVGLMSVGGAVMLGLKRMLVYAAVLICSGGVVIALDAHPGWSLLAGGIAATACGFVLMLQFVREYPIAAAEME